jgi:hypothetical protein
MDVLRQFPYFVGLLKRVFIQAIAASRLIRSVKNNRQACRRRIFSLCN